MSWKRMRLLVIRWLRIRKGPEELGLNVFEPFHSWLTLQSTLCQTQKSQRPQRGRKHPLQLPLTRNPCPRRLPVRREQA